MPRGRQTDIPTAARAVALAELGYSGTQIEALTGLNARTVWGILNNEASWGEVKERSVFKQNRLKQKEALEAATRLLAAKCLVEVEKKIDQVSAYQAVGMTRDLPCQSGQFERQSPITTRPTSAEHRILSCVKIKILRIKLLRAPCLHDVSTASTLRI